MTVSVLVCPVTSMILSSRFLARVASVTNPDLGECPETVFVQPKRAAPDRYS